MAGVRASTTSVHAVGIVHCALRALPLYRLCAARAFLFPSFMGFQRRGERRERENGEGDAGGARFPCAVFPRESAASAHLDQYKNIRVQRAASGHAIYVQEKKYTYMNARWYECKYSREIVKFSVGRSFEIYLAFNYSRFFGCWVIHRVRK